MLETERIFAHAGTNAEDISVAVSRAKGLPYDGNKEMDAYEYGLEQRKAGDGENLDLLIDATDYLDRNPDSEILSDYAEDAGVDKDGKDDIIIIELSAEKYPEVAKHITDAIENGQPEILTIARREKNKRRYDALKDKEKVPGKDLDEYPPSMFLEGGEGVSVRALSPKENRGAGAVIGNKLRGKPDGTKVKITIVN